MQIDSTISFHSPKKGRACHRYSAPFLFEKEPAIQNYNIKSYLFDKHKRQIHTLAFSNETMEKVHRCTFRHMEITQLCTRNRDESLIQNLSFEGDGEALPPPKPRRPHVKGITFRDFDVSLNSEENLNQLFINCICST